VLDDPSTPLRALRSEFRDGCWALNEADVQYHDGYEKRVLEVLTCAKDLSSTSDELLSNATSWAERYHLDPARAHALRSLRLAPDARVLEVGAGCGALSRYLGEQCALLDALEPMTDRAICAHQRTRDLGNVEVFIGTLEGVPQVAAYDVVVIMGVLEYVGEGGSDPAVYLQFLRQAAGLLRPGGTVVLGIENPLGVKYLCGAPEDHSGRPFDSVEGYGRSSPARTFSRQVLESMVGAVGLSPTTLGLFPDYKLTRLAFSDGLLEFEPQMAVQIPHFPSPDWAVFAPRVANEARVWANLVQSGLGGESANSFLILAHDGPGAGPLWPQDVLAVYYPPTGRRMAYAAMSTVVRGPDGTSILRRPLLHDAQCGKAVGFRVEGSTPLFKGDDLIALMALTDSDDELVTLLNDWAAAVGDAMAEGSLPVMDLLPHNALRTAGGAIRFVDSKWDVPGFGRGEVMARAAYQTALRLAAVTSPSRWPAVTVEGLALHIGGLLGLGPRGDWLAGTLDQEVSFQIEITVPDSDLTDVGDRSRKMRSDLEAQLAQPLALPEPAALPVTSATVDEFRAEIARAGGLLNTSESRIAEQAERARSSAEEAARVAAQLAQAEASAAALAASAATTEGALRLELVTVRGDLDALRSTRTFRYSRALRSAYGRLRRRPRPE
jgi:SAM-dependent methyltransferase